MTDFNIEKIAAPCAEFGVVLDSEKTEQLNLYGNLLLQWNEKINLTAITAPDDVLYKHFYDCILFLKHIKVPDGAALIDVGTGAGFPGMVLKIVRPDINVTLLDSLKKRLTFLDCVISELCLDGINTVHMRAEDAGRNKEIREKYDIACARAVASLPVLMEYCVPLVKTGGYFIAMKGAGAFEEERSEKAEKVLGVELHEVIHYVLKNGVKHDLIIYKKTAPTGDAYPRRGDRIRKSPL